MARYIQSNILFQAYVHIEGSFAELEEKKEDIKNDLSEFVTERAQHFLYPDVDVELEFKEGSIKTYATVRGTLRACLRADYTDFTTEVEHLYWFARRLSDASNMEVAFRTGHFLGAIERTEARPGIIGQTKRIIEGILSFNPVDSEKAAGNLVRRVKTTKADAEKLLKNLVDAEDKVLVKSELRSLLKTAPKKMSREKSFGEKLDFAYEDALSSFSKLLR